MLAKDVHSGSVRLSSLKNRESSRKVCMSAENSMTNSLSSIPFFNEKEDVLRDDNEKAEFIRKYKEVKESEKKYKKKVKILELE